jgi:hypothetical protein
MSSILAVRIRVLCRGFPCSRTQGTSRYDPEKRPHRDGWPAEQPGSRRIPCIFPADQGSRPRDGFAPDCLHRQLVGGFGDCEAGAHCGPPKPRIFAGFWARALLNPNQRLRVSGLEGAAVGVCLCCQVRRFGFATDSPQRRLRNLGIGRVCHPQNELSGKVE